MGRACHERHGRKDESKGKKRIRNEDEAIAINATDSDDKNNQVKKKAKKEPKPEKDPNENSPAEHVNSATKKKKESSERPKRVHFSEDIEIFNSRELVRGKRFTPEEDESVKKAVKSYIDSHSLGEEGLHMILHCKKYPQVKHCWHEISAWLPHRPMASVYCRAHNLFERDESRQWTDEEREMVRRFHETHGPKWKELAQVMGKQRIHIKDCWRRIANTNRKKGKWDQEEYDKLFDLVNADLQARVLSESRRSKHGMIRDDIPWTAICEKLETRNQDVCCMKWYQQLTSGMVAEGKWSDADDYRLVKALNESGNCCYEDVEWDDLVEGRAGDVCRRRWMQMVRHIGPFISKPFEVQVRLLTERYWPSLLDLRIAFDNLPFEK